jgi:hypothetical protein
MTAVPVNDTFCLAVVSDPYGARTLCDTNRTCVGKCASTRASIRTMEENTSVGFTFFESKIRNSRTCYTDMFYRNYGPRDILGYFPVCSGNLHNLGQ